MSWLVYIAIAVVLLWFYVSYYNPVSVPAPMQLGGAGAHFVPKLLQDDNIYTSENPYYN